MKASTKGEKLIKVGFRFPQALKDALEKKAAAERRSINDQLIFTLERALSERREDEKADWKQQKRQQETPVAKRP